MIDERRSVDADPRPGRSRPGAALVGFGFGLAPAAWALHLVLGVSFVPLSCDRGSEAWLHATTVVALPIGAAGLLVAWRLRSALRADDNVLLGTVAVSLAVLSIALIVVEQLLVFPLEPCS